VTDGGGNLVRRAADISRGDRFTVAFSDGQVAAIATGDDAPAREKPQKPASGGGTRQGSLF
jgi:hypothetical protein